MERPIKHLKQDQIDDSKRWFIKGVAALGLTASMPAISKLGVELDSENETPSRSHSDNTDTLTGIVDNVDEKERVEKKESLSNSQYFEYYKNYEKRTLRKDKDLVFERSEAITLLREYFVLDIPDLIVKEKLEWYIIGLAFAESRFDTEAKSKAGAFGFLQLMPETIKDLIKEDEDKEDMVTQIRIAARLLKQTYTHITQTNKEDLAVIESEHFGGDNKSFKNYFLIPLLLNSYNAGMGTLSKMVSQYRERFPTAESFVDVFCKGERLSGYDVFIGMTQLANMESWIKWYKDDSTRYTPRVYAACDVIVEAYNEYKEKQMAEL